MAPKNTPKAHSPFLHPQWAPAPQVWSTPYAPAITITSPSPSFSPLYGTSPKPFHSNHIHPAPGTFSPHSPFGPRTPHPSPYFTPINPLGTPHVSALYDLYNHYEEGVDISELTEKVKKAQKERNAAEHHLKEAKEKAAQAKAAAAYPPMGTPIAPPMYFASPTPYAQPFSAMPTYTPGHTHIPMSVQPNGQVVLESPQNCNIYLTSGGYTPTPSYVALSPSPVDYEELGPPDDITIDKWAESGSSFVYDNRESPITLNSQHHVLEINPILARDSIPLLVDLSRRKGDITMLSDPGARWRDDPSSDVGSQPATLPRVTRLRLVSPKTRNTIEVVSAKGVTVSIMFLSF